MTSDPRGEYAEENAAGGMTRWSWRNDPRRLCFRLARYKHTAKMLEGFDRVLEVGCADGFGSRVVRQHVRNLTAIDVNERSIYWARLGSSPEWPIEFLQGDICSGGWGDFDAVYALDVLEHILPDDAFLMGMCSAAPVAVIGTPSKESQAYASATSRAGHVNCYSGAELRERLLGFWSNVFLFTMHDEVLGTSFAPMAQYLLALCVRR